MRRPGDRDGPADDLGAYDLHISVRRADGTWSEARNLGAGINSRFQELYPTVSPDGKYLFFLRNQERGSSVYWVDFSAIERLITEHSPIVAERGMARHHLARVSAAHNGYQRWGKSNE